MLAMALLMAACGGAETTTTQTVTTTAVVTSTAAPPRTMTVTTTQAVTTSEAVTTLPTTTSSTASVEQAESVTKAFMAAWNNAWQAGSDPEALPSLSADDIKYYDATMPGTVITKADIEGMVHDPNWWKIFQVIEKSYFVSGDGRFAAVLGMFALRDASGNLPWQTGASLLKIGNDKIVWEYDYYGGEQGKATPTEPMLTIAAGGTGPGSPAAQTAIADATADVKEWLAAYNGRDAKTFLSFYADAAKCVDLVSPKWRVMTTSQLAADVAAHFPRTEFASKLEPSLGSALQDFFFVSADGRYAAVQGNYEDTGTSGGVPMVVILELQDGKIIQQYNFMAIDASLLQP